MDEQAQLLPRLEADGPERLLLGADQRGRDDLGVAPLGQGVEAAAQEVGRGRGRLGQGSEVGDEAVAPPRARTRTLLSPFEDLGRHRHRSPEDTGG